VKLLFLQRYLQEPVYITAEEPFTGLDEDEIRQVTEFIMGETGKTGIPVVIIETKETGGIPG
jgi:energy-coupling factor transporter ATP-binding protein EcfA2